MDLTLERPPTLEEASSFRGGRNPSSTDKHEARWHQRSDPSKAAVRARCRVLNWPHSRGGKPPQETLPALRSRRAEARRVRRPDGAWTRWTCLHDPPGPGARCGGSKLPLFCALGPSDLPDTRSSLPGGGPCGTEPVPSKQSCQPVPVWTKASLRRRRQGPSEPGRHKGDLARKGSAGGKAAAACAVTAEANLHCRWHWPSRGAATKAAVLEGALPVGLVHSTVS